MACNWTSRTPLTSSITVTTTSAIDNRRYTRTSSKTSRRRRGGRRMGRAAGDDTDRDALGPARSRTGWADRDAEPCRAAPCRAAFDGWIPGRAEFGGPGRVGRWALLGPLEVDRGGCGIECGPAVAPRRSAPE